MTSRELFDKLEPIIGAEKGLHVQHSITHLRDTFVVYTDNFRYEHPDPAVVLTVLTAMANPAKPVVKDGEVTLEERVAAAEHRADVGEDR